jgi:DNA repair protein RadC
MEHLLAVEKPCEKLLQLGPSALSDVELLAALIRHGQKGRSAITIARDLIKKFGSLRQVCSAEQQAFCAVSGVGVVKYAQLHAALEINKRQHEEVLRKETVFNNAQAVRSYVQIHLRDRQREIFGVLLLDSQHQLIAYRELFSGTLQSAAVYPREIVKQVLLDNAAAVILVHNHPSGVGEPSQADIRITKEIKSALSLIDVSVLDHFIVADASTLSLAERGEI